jgi:hypothetical protein
MEWRLPQSIVHGHRAGLRSDAKPDSRAASIEAIGELVSKILYHVRRARS